MRFNCGLTKEQKLANRVAYLREQAENFSPEEKKREVFAWLPKRVGNNDCRWLENVVAVMETKLKYSCLDPESVSSRTKAVDEIDSWMRLVACGKASLSEVISKLRFVDVVVRYEAIER